MVSSLASRLCQKNKQTRGVDLVLPISTGVGVFCQGDKMEYFPKVLCGWSWEENKLFELALAVVDEQHPDRWEAVAAMVGGQKSAQDMHNHYVILLEDLQFIESGKLDHELGQEDRSVCWTDEDNKLLVRLDIN
ncbi:hypothetical protein HRI_001266800 [Hibiscus trionum]|uniref:Myb-like domain-containing protein n=2 Tax=Hibiscus trionum TaxID=183268 RepID=A0A9W7HEC9_HIBTR|nr:hypothetical protein HRI_001266800 [Hibiscus trionum]